MLWAVGSVFAVYGLGYAWDSLWLVVHESRFMALESPVGFRVYWGFFGIVQATVFGNPPHSIFN
jgi:hypothetical protein